MEEKQYRNTKQREYVLHLLKNHKSHPTASDIYDKMKVQFPSLSLGTVYRNLTILLQQKKIIKLDFGSTFDHYDGDCSEHSHFICNECQKVYDFPYKGEDLYKINQTTEHLIEGCLIKYYGRCEDCIIKRKEEDER